MSRPELARRRESKAAVLETILHGKYNKGARCHSRAPLVDRLKFYRVSQPEIFGERVLPDQGNPS